MIGELVKYPAPAGLSREEIIKDAQGVVSRWQAEPQLIRKHFLFDGGEESLGIYLWKNREAAEAAHDEVWRQRVRDVHGSEPSISYYDTLMIVDNLAEEVSEY